MTMLLDLLKSGVPLYAVVFSAVVGLIHAWLKHGRIVYKSDTCEISGPAGKKVREIIERDQDLQAATRLSQRLPSSTL